MRRSDAFLHTRREAGEWENEAVGLAVRAHLIRQYGGGLFGFTSTGERIRQNVIQAIVEEMDAIGGQRVSLPNLQPRAIWERSGRWENFEDEMLTLRGRTGTEYCLAPTHEEAIVHLLDGVIRSYDDLPLLVYQVGRKHRDDHPRYGLLRMKEFTMKDAYSVHVAEPSLDRWYERVRTAYIRIFERLGLEFVIADAENAAMGGSDSEEFLAPVETGSEPLLRCRASECRFGTTDVNGTNGNDRCPTCGGELERVEAIELGHIFKLGTHYSERMNLTVVTDHGERRHVTMGCYGVGVERLIHALLEQHGRPDGCRWPGGIERSVAPYRRAIIPLRYDGEMKKVADRLYSVLDPAETLLFDDPSQSIGERFVESDLLGIPRKYIIGNRYLDRGEVEIESRDGETLETAPADQLLGTAERSTPGSETSTR